MCIIVVANILRRSGHAIRSSHLLHFISLSTIVADVPSHFPTSQRCNMIVLAALNGDPFWPPNVTFNEQKNGQGELVGRQGRLFLILYTTINHKMQKKNVLKAH